MNQSELAEDINGMSSSARERLRSLAERDNYVFCKGILGMAEMNQQLHKPLCDALNREERLRSMWLISRGHLKSSVITVGNNMRHALSNSEHRIMIGNEVHDNSLAFVGQIKGLLETNELIRALWPERLPTRTTGPGISWSATGLTLVRKGSYKEPTFFPIGVGGAATSKHFTRITLDDLIGLEARRSRTTMKNTIVWNNNVEALVVNARDTIIEWVGTRWMIDDLYGDVIDTYGDDLGMFHRTCYNPDGTLTFPELMSHEFLERMKRKDYSQFSAQYLNDPEAGENRDFDFARLGTFHRDHRGIVFWEDRGEMKMLDPMRQMDRVMSVDPNGGKKAAKDEAAISVLGQGPAPDAFVFSLDSYGGRPNPSELLDQVIATYQKWRPRVIAVEEAGQQTTLFHLQERFKASGFPDIIVASKPANQDKEERIRAYVQPVINDFRLKVPTNQVELRTLIEKFPVLSNVDRLDALAYAVPLLRTPASQQEEYEYRKSVRNVLKRRSRITGY